MPFEATRFSPCRPLGSAFLAGCLALQGGRLPAQNPPGPDKPTLAVLVLQGAFASVPGQQGQAGQGPRFRRGLGAQALPPAPVRSRPLGEQLVQRIDMAYLKTDRFQLIERAQMKAVLKEAALEQNGTVDDATAVTLGRQLGAKFVLVGSYSGTMARGVAVTEHVFSKDTREPFLEGKLEVRLRLVRTEDGTIQEPMILNATAKAPQGAQAFDGLMDAFSRVLEHELAVRYPLSGFVVKLLSDKEILADLGRVRGVGPGDVFLVLEAGEDAVHPVTGKRVPGERKVVGEMVVTDAGQESSTLRLISGRPRFRPGLLLERKPN